MLCMTRAGVYVDRSLYFAELMRCFPGGLGGLVIRTEAGTQVMELEYDSRGRCNFDAAVELMKDNMFSLYI